MPTTSAPEPVAVLGLGRMGTAIARTLLTHGHPTTVWNRSAGHDEVLAAAGAVRARTPAEAARAAGLVLVCVADAAAVQDVLDQVGVDVGGRALLNLTSTTPEEARVLAARAVGLGATYLDGAVMAIPPGIGTDRAAILYSGDPAVLDTHRPTLETLATAVWVGADPGAAALRDLALLGMMWSALGGFYQAVALVGTDGQSATQFAPIAADWLRTVAGFLAGDAEEIDARHYTNAVSILDVNAAGLELLRRTCARRGVPLGVAGAVRQLVDTRLAEGRGTDSLASLAELFRSSRAGSAS